MNLTRRSLFASAVALLALPRRVAAERLLGPVSWTTGWMPCDLPRGRRVSISSTGTLRLDWSNRLSPHAPALAYAVLAMQERIVAQIVAVHVHHGTWRNA